MAAVVSSAAVQFRCSPCRVETMDLIDGDGLVLSDSATAHRVADDQQHTVCGFDMTVAGSWRHWGEDVNLGARP